ncbi:MAG TPA: ribosome maturation factor RimM [Solirubrobacteraceae bacterium]|nr:ribosome maturation factor RimM [Solirubrobacteraceae bacterium]
MLVAGRVGRPHGLDGSFHVVDGRPALLASARVTLSGRALRVQRRAGTDARPILRLEGVGDRAAAEALRGADLLVARADAPVLGAEEWYAEDLEGCVVADGPRELGRVRRLVPLPSCEALEVARPGEPDLLVPLVRDAVRAVDVGARRIEVDSGFLAG